MKLRKAAIGAGLAAVAVWATGCATNRGILDVRVPSVPDPSSAKAVKIVSVTDNRVFELKPKTASVPSLKDKAINDKSITSRAIARKRNAYGKALGDIVLPEGRTVCDLVKESLTQSLREKGYSVVEPTAPGADKAIPVQAEIQQFWSWFTPGFWTLSLEFEAIVNIKAGQILVHGPEQKVRGYVKLHSQAATTRAWVNTVQKGLEDLNGKTKEELRAP